ncbi:MAG: sulfatase-like hydrolase/transferase [Bacteroidales bacterium]|nr:sulfatase-like hydrolase/transferase [Bacteroidales bacterium]
MRMYIRHLRLLLSRFMLLIILYTLSRIFFYFVNYHHFNDLSFPGLLFIFIAGIRFDIAAVIFTNIIFFMLYIIPGNFKDNQGFQKMLLVAFLVVNAFALLSNFIDAKYFDFINKRSTASVFTLFATDRGIWSLVPQFIKDYWYIAVSWMIMMAVTWYYVPCLKECTRQKEKLTAVKYLYQTGIFMGIMLFFFWGARGTGLKPISVIDAAQYTELKNIPLIINTPFSMIRSLGKQNLTEYNFYTEDSVTGIYEPVKTYKGTEDFRRMNVIIIILESFSKEYIGYYNSGKGYTPNLDSLLKQSLVFENGFANGTRSNEAMPSIIAGIPTLMEEPYSSSLYASNIIQSLPSLLKSEGYTTAFFHGGNNGTMGFDNFAKVAGIDLYYGRDEYHNDSDYDGKWGIWDEPFLQYFAETLNSYEEPFCASVYTLSSHHPYSIPENHTGRFTEERLPILKSIKYADYALGRFFKTASGMPWYDHTLFVLTADHAAQAVEAFYNSSVGMYAIPLAFLSPSDSTLKGFETSTAQQIDIMPTVLNYLSYPEPFFAFGVNLLDTSQMNFAISYNTGIYQLIVGDSIMLFDGQHVVSFYNWRKQAQPETFDISEIMQNPAEKARYESIETGLKAMVQVYNNRMIENRLTP